MHFVLTFSCCGCMIHINSLVSIAHTLLTYHILAYRREVNKVRPKKVCVSGYPTMPIFLHPFQKSRIKLLDCSSMFYFCLNTNSPTVVSPCHVFFFEEHMFFHIQESPPQFENQIMAWVYVRSICTKKLHFVSRNWCMEK